jgi:hypothetical protein
MELEHQHERRLPNTESEPNGFGFADTGHPNSNTDSHTGYPNSNTDSHGYPEPNGHGISDTDSGDTDPNSDTNRDADSGTDLHVDLRQLDCDHHCGYCTGGSLSIEHHGGGCE